MKWFGAPSRKALDEKIEQQQIVINMLVGSVATMMTRHPDVQELLQQQAFTAMAQHSENGARQ